MVMIPPENVLIMATKAQVKAPAWKAYDEAMASARKAYNEATAPAWKAYDEAMASARKAYYEAMK